MRRMMRLSRVAVAAVMVAGVGVVGQAVAADPASAGTGRLDGGVIAACSTSQFGFTEHATIRNVPGGSVIGDAYPGDVVNVSSYDGSWAYGNFYHVPDSGTKYRYNTGWVLRSKLYFIRCV